MAKVLEMPKLSPTMEEGLLAIWHKKEGDTVGVDDLLAEVETDKATMEFRSFDRGTLLKLLVGPGVMVKLGQPVAILGQPGEDVSELAAKLANAKATSAPTTGADSSEPRPTPLSAGVPPTLAPPAEIARFKKPTYSVLERTQYGGEQPDDLGDGRVLASPFVRKTARDRGIDLTGRTGSGPGGRVLPADLDGLAAATAALAVASHGRAQTTALVPPDVRALSPMRRTIARRLTEAKRTVPHFYLSIDVEVGELMTFRESLNADLTGKPSGDGDKPLKLSVNDLIIKAVAAALVRVPECNAQFSDEGLLIHRRVDISVAVAVPDGLVTPVVRDADQKSVSTIAKEIRDLAARARAKKLKPEEMSDGTFSVSNLGMFGIDVFSAVINPPEGAILAVGQVRDEPVVKAGAVVAGRRLGMTLSCDHRVIDGAVGAAFLAELRALLEHPMRILA